MGFWIIFRRKKIQEECACYFDWYQGKMSNTIAVLTEVTCYDYVLHMRQCIHTHTWYMHIYTQLHARMCTHTNTQTQTHTISLSLSPGYCWVLFKNIILFMFIMIMNMCITILFCRQNHFHTIGSPLKCITSFPTLESQIKRFLDLVSRVVFLLTAFCCHYMLQLWTEQVDEVRSLCWSQQSTFTEITPEGQAEICRSGSL